MSTTTYDTKRVHLYDGANEIAEITPTGSEWLQSGVNLSAGNHEVQVNGEDQAGNLSGFRKVHVITGTNIAPAVDLLDDTGLSSTDNYTADSTPRIQVAVSLPTPSGAGAPALSSINKIALYKQALNDEYEEFAVTSANHNDEDAVFMLSPALEDGTHSFKGRWQDKFGNWSDLGLPLNIIIDTQSPTAPTFDNLVDGQVVIGNVLSLGGEIF